MEYSNEHGGSSLAPPGIPSYLSRWIGEEEESITPTLQARAQAWADFLEEAVPPGERAECPPEFLIDLDWKAPELMKSLFPTTSNDMRTVMEAAFQMVPTGQTHGLFLGEWFRLVRVVTRPVTCVTKGQLAQLWKAVLQEGS